MRHYLFSITLRRAHMGFIYNICIAIYGVFIAIAALFNPKAKLLYTGQRDVFKLLERKIVPNSNYVWFHAASLGEFEQGRPVIEQLKKEQPSTKILLTFFSPSGYEIRKNYTGADIVSYLPLDTKSNAVRFVKLVQPSKAIFIKYEFWPNYLLALQSSNVPAFSISALFRPNQVFFKWYGGWYKNLLTSFTHVFVQDTFSKDLLLSNGMDHVSVAGDTRFDRVLDLFTLAKELPLIEEFVKGSKKIIVAGSSWGKDEELLVSYLKSHADTKLILVPHEIHTEHINAILGLLQGKCVRYTEATTANLKAANCLVVDSIGILSSIYRYATVAYIGGGFGVGIHNTLEAAVYGVPVVFGPNFQKFREARELIAAGGAFSISNYAEFEIQLDKLVEENGAGKIAGDYVKQNTGATQKIIYSLLNKQISS